MLLQDFPQAKVFLSLDLNTSVELMLKIEAKMQIGKYHSLTFISIYLASNLRISFML